MRFLQKMFSKEPNLLLIEQNSIKTNKELFDLIIKTEKILNELNEYLINNNISFKDAKMAEFENSLLNMKSKTDALKMDVQRILDIEMKHKNYVLLNDDFYLKDKLVRLDTMTQVLEELLDLISDRPALNELKEMMKYIYSKVSGLVDSINNLNTDDRYLEAVYSKLREL